MIIHGGITYAAAQAQEQNLEIDYRYQNYLDLTDTKQFDAVMLIYGDYCPLPPGQRTRLLKKIRRALKPAGYFALDVTTPIHRQKHGIRKNWYLVETGFWKPGPHLVLENGFDYSDKFIYLDQAIVIEDGGKVSVYRNWFQDFNRETITRELEAGGFAVKSAWSDLNGTPYAEDTEWIGLITRKI